MKKKQAVKINDKPPGGDFPVSYVTVLYNRVTNLAFGNKDDILADDDTVKCAKNIAEVLKKENLNVALFEVNEKTVKKLPELKTDFFFNLCGGIGNIPGSEPEVPKILDEIGIPYSGAVADKLKLTTDKVETKKQFLKLGIPTPPYQVFSDAHDKLKPQLKFPLIVKPSSEDCSLGIDSDSVVDNEKMLRKKITKIIKKYKEPALVESYINSRELNVTVVGRGHKTKMLPVSEIIFGKSYDSGKKKKIVDFSAKWHETSVNYHDTVGICPAKLSESARKKLEKYVLRAYQQICGDPGYARMDIRFVQKPERIYFLEINLNPDISDGMGAARSAKTFGWAYPQFLKKIIEFSLDRFK